MQERVFALFLDNGLTARNTHGWRGDRYDGIHFS